MTAAIGPALGALGGLFSGAFGSDKILREFYTPEFQPEILATGQGLAGDRAIRNRALAAYEQAQARRAQMYDQLAGLARGDYQKAIDQLTSYGYSPMGIEENLRRSRLADWSNLWNQQIPAGLSLADKLNSAARGFTGSRGGSWVDAANRTGLSNRAAQSWDALMAGISPGAAALSSGVLANLGGLGALIGGRTGTGAIGEGIELTPATAAITTQGGILGNLQNLINAGASNVAGFKKASNWADRLGAGLQGAGGALGGGLLGGGGGGGMGSLGALGSLFGGTIGFGGGLGAAQGVGGLSNPTDVMNYNLAARRARKNYPGNYDAFVSGFEQSPWE